ncbi:MAG: alpha/beta hydrolase family protein [Longimicrobiales bacterium]
MTSKATTREAKFEVPGAGTVDALLNLPAESSALYVLAHGAGAPMRHAFMNAIAAALADRSIATLRYNFPYSQAGKRGPDRPAVLEATVHAALTHARVAAPGLALFAGGKSMGGRMTSQAIAHEAEEDVRGIAFLGFPLHGAGKPPDAKRAEHLADVRVPMLFVQGTRDSLARLDLVQNVVDGLGERATLQVIDDADHGFHVRKSSGRDDAGVMIEIADSVASWMATLQ